MRLNLTLQRTGHKRLLPINYQYELSSWIDRAMSPICISVKKEDHAHPQYMHPMDTEYQHYFSKHLLEKSTARQMVETNGKSVKSAVNMEDLSLNILSSYPRSRLIRLKAHTAEETRQPK